MMNRKAIIRAILLAGALIGLGVPQLASATVSGLPCQVGTAPSDVVSCATGVYANISVLGGVLDATIGPVADASGTAPGPYDTGAISLANLNASISLLGALGLGVNADLITDRASSPYNGTLATLSSTATSTVLNLDLALGTPQILVVPAIPLLSVGASTISSTSSASKTTGKLITSGSSYIADLAISVAGGAPIAIDASVFASLPVNYDILSADALNIVGLSIFANYQTPILDGTDKVGTQTSALAIFLNGFDGGLLSGTILIGNSAAAVPEPSTWLMMIFGFGVVGVAARRRQTVALAVA